MGVSSIETVGMVVQRIGPDVDDARLEASLENRCGHGIARIRRNDDFIALGRRQLRECAQNHGHARAAG
jgi:hypothetical protein